MKRFLPYLVSILGILLLLYLMTALGAAASAFAQRTFRLPFQFWVGQILLQVLVGVLLAVPTWLGWPRRFAPDWPVLFLYLVPGLLLATGRLTFPFLGYYFDSPLTRGLANGMLSSSAAAAGGILAGYGIGQSFRSR